MDSKRSIKALILAHLDGELTGEDLKKLTDWLADSRENVRYYAQIKDLWEASLTDTSRIAETEKEWAKLIQKIKKEVRNNMFRHHTNLQIIWRFAAILVIGIVMGVVVIKYTSERPPLYITAVAPKGSVTQMILADSTLVYLNAGTEIRYSPESEQKKREVFLNGEAWFDVARQKNSPFVVHTSLYDINVTGTRFNVKSYDSDPEITTTLEEGEIRINATEKFQLAEAIILKPGEQAALDKNTKQINIKQVDTKLFTSWKDNKLIFLNMNFKELIVLLERKYGVEIEINNQGILKYHYTGTIKNESILEILEIIKHTLPIQYKIEGQKIIINKMKQEK